MVSRLVLPLLIALLVGTPALAQTGSLTGTGHDRDALGFTEKIETATDPHERFFPISVFWGKLPIDPLHAYFRRLLESMGIYVTITTT